MLRLVLALTRFVQAVVPELVLVAIQIPIVVMDVLVLIPIPQVITFVTDVVVMEYQIIARFVIEGLTA